MDVQDIVHNVILKDGSQTAKLPPPSSALLPRKFKQIKVNDLKWIRYLIILSS